MSTAKVILEEYLTRISYQDALSLASSNYNFNVAITEIQSNVSIWKKRFEYKYDIKPTYNLSIDQWKQLFFLLDDMEKYGLDFNEYFSADAYKVGYSQVKDVQVLEFIQQEFGKPYKQTWLYKIILLALENNNDELAIQIISKLKLRSWYLEKLYTYAVSEKLDIASFLNGYLNLPLEPRSVQKPFLCTIENLLIFERSGKLGYGELIASEDITAKMIAILVDWIMLVTKTFKLLISTYSLFVSILYAYVSRKQDLKMTNLQKVGCACLSLAAKYNEIYPPEPADFLFVSENAFTVEDLNLAEEDVFKTLGCNIALSQDMDYIRVISTVSTFYTETHDIAKHIFVAVSIARPSVLPSVLCTAIAKIVSTLQMIPFANPFNVPESVINVCANEILRLFKKLNRSTLDIHKTFYIKIDKSKEIAKGIVNSKEFIEKDYVTYNDYTLKRFFKPNLEIYLLPSTEIPSDMVKLGEGSFGVVKKFDYKGKSYAIKKMRNLFEEGLSGSFVREVSVLLSLNHPHIVQLRFVVQDLNQMAFDLGISDMKEWLNLNGQVNSKIQVDIAHQLVSGLSYMHDMGCIHRDIKPQNVIVFNGAGGYNFQLADLGSTRGPHIAIPAIYTHEVCTLWYRSPELLFGMQSYNSALDVWSILCTLYECGSGGNALFPENMEIDQIFKICSIMGRPTELSWPGVTALSDYPKGMPEFKSQVNFFRNTKALSECLVDLLESSLVMDPEKRPKSRQLLEIINDYRV